MKYGKKQLLLLLAACLFGSTALACEEGNLQTVRLSPLQTVRLASDEAQQIHVFGQFWQAVHPLSGDPLQEFAVTDLDGNGLLEILVRPYKGKRAPVIYEVTPQRKGLNAKSKAWYDRYAYRHHIAWFLMHPETAAGPWNGYTEEVEMMLQDSYDIYTGRKDAFG